MKIKKGETVLIISGKDRGKTGKVLKVFPEERKLMVEGVNIMKKHQRPKKAGTKGQVVQMPKPVSVSSVKLVCPKCEKPSKTGYRLTQEGKKYKMCKKCGADV